MEQDNELKGVGNSLDFGARMCDSRVGRWLSLDPLTSKFPYQSPYVYAGNNPVFYIDKNGLFKLNYSEEQLKNLGLSKLDVARFESIVANIYNLVKDNPQALDALVNTTGFNIDEIEKDFTLNQGPEIFIQTVPITYASGGIEGIKIDPIIIKNLAKINTNDKANLAEYVFATALTIIHEYGHYGDQICNMGNNTGQYNHEEKKTLSGIFLVPINDSEKFGDNNIEYGSQKWTKSITGHRGDDIEVMGFGLYFSVDEYGQFQRNYVDPRKIVQRLLEKIPKSLPKDAEGEKILETLKVN